MYPEICTLGPFTIYSYGLMLAIAFAVSSSLLIRQAKKEGINPDAVFNLAFIVFTAGLTGARLFYVIEHFAYYSKNPLEVIMLQHGGLAWFGGLMAGVIAGVLYLKNKKLPILTVMDLMVPFVALGQAIGRIGCLLNGCCFGRGSIFGLYFPVHQLILIPVQMYSSLLLVIIFIILRALQERPHGPGKILYAYLLLYSLKRFFVEFWRADNQIVFLRLTLFQILSILMFVFALIQLALMKTNKTRVP
ncbi:MAG: prolipoprotein diacylglyceryl transferase [Candidatus Omnitrophota bacterium]